MTIENIAPEQDMRFRWAQRGSDQDGAKRSHTHLDEEDGQLDNLTREALEQQTAVFDQSKQLNELLGKYRSIRGRINLGRDIGDRLIRREAAKRDIDEWRRGR